MLTSGVIPPAAGLFSRAIKAPNMEGRAVQDMANEATELRKVLADQLINVGAPAALTRRKGSGIQRVVLLRRREAAHLPTSAGHMATRDF